MSAFIKKHSLTLLGILVGAIAGFWYYSAVGCASGTCIITSNPFISTAYGAMLGGLLFNSFQKESKTQSK